jgi:hypothetical protein
MWAVLTHLPDVEVDDTPNPHVYKISHGFVATWGILGVWAVKAMQGLFNRHPCISITSTIASNVMVARPLHL